MIKRIKVAMVTDTGGVSMNYLMNLHGKVSKN